MTRRVRCITAELLFDTASSLARLSALTNRLAFTVLPPRRYGVESLSNAELDEGIG